MFSILGTVNTVKLDRRNFWRYTLLLPLNNQESEGVMTKRANPNTGGRRLNIVLPAKTVALLEEVIPKRRYTSLTEGICRGIGLLWEMARFPRIIDITIRYRSETGEEKTQTFIPIF